VAFWYYLRPAPGELLPVPLRTMEAFFRGRARLPADGGGAVHYVRVRVAVVRRTALAIEDIACQRVPVRDDGRLDEEQWLRRAGAEIVLAARRTRAPSPGVLVDARDRFEARRQDALLRWQPTQEDAAALRALVNRRAGWEVL
jgi:hypothetical protein